MKRAMIKYLAALIFDAHAGKCLILASSMWPLKNKLKHMKTKARNSLTLGLALIGSYLFYKQDAGINIFIFTIISAIAFIYVHKQKGFKTLSVAIIPTLLSSIFIVWYPQLLTRVICILSYLLMWSAITPSTFPMVVLIQGLLSILQSPLSFLKKRDSQTQAKEKTPGNRNIMIYMITTSIILIFITLYIHSNPVFSKLFSEIDLSFIEFGFIMTVTGLYVLLYGLVKINTNKNIRYLNSLKSSITKTQLSKRDEQEASHSSGLSDTEEAIASTDCT